VRKIIVELHLDLSDAQRKVKSPLSKNYSIVRVSDRKMEISSKSLRPSVTVLASLLDLCDAAVIMPLGRLQLEKRRDTQRSVSRPCLVLGDPIQQFGSLLTKLIVRHDQIESVRSNMTSANIWTAVPVSFCSPTKSYQCSSFVGLEDCWTGKWLLQPFVVVVSAPPQTMHLRIVRLGRSLLQWIWCLVDPGPFGKSSNIFVRKHQVQGCANHKTNQPVAEQDNLVGTSNCQVAIGIDARSIRLHCVGMRQHGENESKMGGTKFLFVEYLPSCQQAF
jgi:hypothetical protein